MGELFGLIDCNNFYVSCERVFRPDLEGKPVIVLSNNDGCAVARSAEAKLLAIKMGDPEFKIRDLIRRENVRVFSSNYSLYGDLSRRVGDTLGTMVPTVETYSIDESFLNLGEFNGREVEPLARELRDRVHRWVGIPTCVGIAPTKTLAKVANFIAKNSRYDRGPADFDRRHVINVTSFVRIPSPVHNGFEKAVLGGWEHTMIFNYTGGYPFSVLSGRDNASTGTPNQRASVVPGVSPYLGKRSTAATQFLYLNPAAFVQPAQAGNYGDSGRNAYRGPAYTTVDMGLLKNFPVTERVMGVFRFEAFNVLNHTNLQLPSNTFSSGSFSQNQITSSYDARILQLALRLSF